MHFYQEYSTKVIKSGNVVEIFTYLENAFVRTHRSERSERGNSFRERKEEYNERGGNRARSMLKRLLYANFDTPNKYFITLTFDDNLLGFDSSDVFSANLYFSAFRKRLTRAIPSVKWLYVPERQKRGALHYHLVTDADIKPTEKNNFEKSLYYNAEIANTNLRDIWGGGYVSVAPVDGDILKTSTYLGKYMCKQPISGARRYNCSQNLKRPDVLYTNRLRKELEKDYPVLAENRFQKFGTSYNDKTGGTIEYSLYLPDSN